MTIDDVMALAERACAHSRHKTTQWCADEVIHKDLRAAILALLDAEAQACAAACQSALHPNPTTMFDAAAHNVGVGQCIDIIRARIAARKGEK